MFFRSYSKLSALARPEALPAPRAPGSLREWAQTGAQLAMSRDLPGMRLSERLADPAAYLRLQRARRQALEALLVVEPEGAVVERATDLICMIAEESTWSKNAGGAVFDDERHPEIDFQCAETAALFAWAARGLGERLDSRASGKLLYEVRRRVFAPFLAHADYPFMRGRGGRPLAILCDILLSALLLESDDARRNALLKQGLRLMDQAVAARDSRIEPLAEQAAETGAVTDLCLLLRRATRGEVDLTEVYPAPDWLDALLFSWLEGDYFADPATRDMRPPVSGQELFRIGLATGDEALTALGAGRHRSQRLPSATLTGRILDMSCASMLDAEAGKPPRVKHAATAHNRLMLSRFNGMTCAVHTGARRGNAGNLILFAEKQPILVEIPECANLPSIGAYAQISGPDAFEGSAAFDADACPADFEVQPDRELMSVDLTQAYPVDAAVRTCQRTAMVLRREAVLRIVDAFDLAQPAPITFHFVTPEKPERLMNGLRLGPVDLTWEGGLRADIAPMNLRFPAGDAAGKALYRIALKTAEPVSRGFFAFSFTPTQA